VSDPWFGVMTQVIADLTVSVERTFDADAPALFDVLADPETLGDVERATSGDRATPSDRSTTGAPADATAPPPRLSPGESYVGDVDVPIGADVASFESFFTVEKREADRLVLSGGGDADAGSFDARVVVAVADVQDGAVVRVDARLDVAGDVAAAGSRAVRAGTTRVLERYLSGVEQAVARPSSHQ